MAQKFKYSDGSIGVAKWFSYNGVQYSPAILEVKSGESNLAFATRLANYGVQPVIYVSSTYDPNTQDIGDPVETTNSDGWLEISYPNPIDKIPVWNTTTKERMYISDGAAAPPGYTTQEPTCHCAKWDAENEEWYCNLEEYKSEQLAAIQNEKKRVRDGGIDINGTVFDSDFQARQSYSLFRSKLSEDSSYESPYWQASKYTYVTMNSVLLGQVETAIEQLLADVFAWQKGAVEAIDAATTEAEVEAVGTTYASPGVNLSDK